MLRYLSVDLLRGVAIVLMVLVHFVDDLSPREASTASLYDAISYLGSAAAPLFTFVAGLSFSVWARKQKATGATSRAVTRTAARRGAFLFVVGIAFNFCVWLPQDALNWDILTLLGAALAVLAVARHLPPPVLALVVVLIVLLSPPLRVLGDFTEYWEDDAYTYDFTLRDSVFGFVSNGYFPLFPWLVFPLAGYVVGEVYFANRKRPVAPAWSLPALGVGLLVVATVFIIWGNKLPAIIVKHYARGYTEFPASTEFVLGMLGLCMVLLWLLHRLCDRSESVGRWRFVVGPLRRFSSFSLTMYFAHHVVHLWPLWVYGATAGGDDSTIYWRNAIGTPLALGLAVAFLVLADIGLRFLERRKKYSFEALMRRVCG